MRVHHHSVTRSGVPALFIPPPSNPWQPLPASPRTSELESHSVWPFQIGFSLGVGRIHVSSATSHGFTAPSVLAPSSTPWSGCPTARVPIHPLKDISAASELWQLCRELRKHPCVAFHVDTGSQLPWANTTERDCRIVPKKLSPSCRVAGCPVLHSRPRGARVPAAAQPFSSVA